MVLDRQDYMTEMYRILNDRDTYTLLLSDPKNKYLKELEAIVARGSQVGILNKKESLYLVSRAPRTPTIYYLPKIHKNPVCPGTSYCQRHRFTNVPGGQVYRLLFAAACSKDALVHQGL